MGEHEVQVESVEGTEPEASETNETAPAEAQAPAETEAPVTAEDPGADA